MPIRQRVRKLIRRPHSVQRRASAVTFESLVSQKWSPNCSRQSSCVAAALAGGFSFADARRAVAHGHPDAPLGGRTTAKDSERARGVVDVMQYSNSPRIRAETRRFKPSGSCALDVGSALM